MGGGGQKCKVYTKTFVVMIWLCFWVTFIPMHTYTGIPITIPTRQQSRVMNYDIINHFARTTIFAYLISKCYRPRNDKGYSPGRRPGSSVGGAYSSVCSCAAASQAALTSSLPSLFLPSSSLSSSLLPFQWTRGYVYKTILPSVAK